MLYSRIEEAGLKKGFTSVTAVALAALGTSGTSAASRWNRSENITSIHLLKLSRLLGVSVDYLLGNDEFISVPKPVVQDSELNSTVISQQETIQKLTTMLSNALAYRDEVSASQIKIEKSGIRFNNSSISESTFGFKEKA